MAAIFTHKRVSANPIDFVITWVDGSDRNWQLEKTRYLPGASQSVDNSARRYRDWGLLKYLFRSIERFAPWVNRVYFITCGHVPDWLNLDADNLVHVKHSDYMPDKYLPTFSSHPIELNMHRIEGLSEHFVYFNDDTFLTRSVEPELFFKNGVPVLCPELHGIIPWGDTGVMAHVYVNVTSAVNRHFDYSKALATNRGKFFNPARIGARAVLENLYCAQHNDLPGFRAVHLPTPTLRGTMEEVWQAEPELMEQTCKSRFRSAQDVSQYVFWYWQMMSGKFHPARSKDLGCLYTIGPDTDKIVDAIKNMRHPMLCANDMGGLDEEEFEAAQHVIMEAFEEILPKKSKYEV